MNDNTRPVSSSEIASPVFLVGAERSGTTLLRLMLDHHPELAFQFEFEFAVDQMKDGAFPAIERYHEFLATDRIFQASGFQIDKTLTYPDLVASFLQQRRQRDGKPLIGATVHRHFDRLLTLWPNARFIHLIRDPRDVARSCIRMNWAGNCWKGVERWLEAEQCWDRVRNAIPASRWTEIRYETLVSTPVDTLVRLCEFIGIDYHPAMFDYIDASSYDFPNQRLANQWRTRMSPREIRLVESRAGRVMQQRGYPLQYPGSPAPGRLGQLWLTLESAAIVKARRVSIYGLPLSIASWISNRLNWRTLQKRVQLKRNEIDNSMLK